jgi:hypothetical protein
MVMKFIKEKKPYVDHQVGVTVTKCEAEIPKSIRKVKQLVWGDAQEWDGNTVYETIYGTSIRQYRIVAKEGDASWGEGRMWYYLYMAGDNSGPYRTPELAMKTAQEHYVGFVNSAFEEVPNES